MEIFDSVILGALQGLTEFLPISSSGHLVIGERLLGLPVVDLKSFDVAVHMGTLIAIFVYFWKDFWEMLKALGGIVTGRVSETATWDNDDERYASLITFIILGTIPAVFVGLFLGDRIDGFFRDPAIVGASMVIMGLFFLLAERVGERVKHGRINMKRSLLIGLFQAVALIPGISRAGATIGGGLLAGLRREKAAKFSFLLGAPAIAGAGILTAMKDGLGTVELWPVLIGFVVAGGVGFLAIWGLMKFLKNHSLLVFAVYLLVVGTASAFLL